ncbi:MAG: hypothetical protein AAF441_17105 [Pseudomonadota bacterium]
MRKFNPCEPTVYFTPMTIAFGAVWIFLVGARDLVSTEWAQLPAIVWIAVIYLAVFATAGTFLLCRFAFIRLPASMVLTYGHLTPVFVILILGAIGHGWALTFWRHRRSHQAWSPWPRFMFLSC